VKKYQYTLNKFKIILKSRVFEYFPPKLQFRPSNRLWWQDGAAFQPLIEAAISATLSGASQAYGVAVEGRTATLQHDSGAIASIDNIAEYSVQEVKKG
jgi:hypothetical protein